MLIVYPSPTRHWSCLLIERGLMTEQGPLFSYPGDGQTDEYCDTIDVNFSFLFFLVATSVYFFPPYYSSISLDPSPVFDLRLDKYPRVLVYFLPLSIQSGLLFLFLCPSLALFPFRYCY